MSRRPSRSLTAVLCVALLLMGAIAGVRARYRALSAKDRDYWSSQLAQGADRAAVDLQRWLDDGSYETRLAAKSIRGGLVAAGWSERATRGLTALLTRANTRYAWLIAADASQIVGASAMNASPAPEEQRAAAEVIASGGHRIVALPPEAGEPTQLSFVVAVAGKPSVALIVRKEATESIRHLMSSKRTRSGRTFLIRPGVDVLIPNRAEDARDRLKVLPWTAALADSGLGPLLLAVSGQRSWDGVFAVAPVSGTDWLLVRSVSRAFLARTVRAELTSELLWGFGVLLSVGLAVLVTMTVSRARAGSELAAVLAAVPEIVLVLDQHGKYLRVPGSSKGLALPARALQGLNVRDVLPPDRAALVLGAIRSTLSRQQTTELEYSLRLDDRETWFHALISPLGSSSVLWVARDITDAKAAGEELRSREQHYRMLFRGHPQPMWLIDPETSRFLEVNSAAEALYGWSSEEFRGRLLGDICVRVKDENAVPASPFVRGAVFQRHVTRSGKSIDVEIVFNSLTLEGRRIELVSVHDVTARVLAEAAMRASERRLSIALSASRSALWEADLVTGHLALTEEWEALLGYPVTDRSPSIRSWSSLIHPSDWIEARQSFLGHARGGDLAFEATMRVKGRAGRWIWISVSGQVIERDDEGNPLRILGTARDVTEKRDLSERLLQSQKMEAVGQLAGGIAHDFNNLLTVVTANAELVLGSLDAQHPAVEDVKELHKAAERGARLTRQLLAFGRRSVMALERVDLNLVITDMATMLRRLIGEDVKLDFALAELPAIVEVDRSQLEQVIVNLAVNARDAMPGGGCLSIETSADAIDGARIGEGPPQRIVTIRVRDTGVGMDDETRAHIFEPFFTTKSVGRGTGLGLATVYGIVRQSGGTIQVESEKGLGSVFTIRLPLKATCDVRPDVPDLGPVIVPTRAPRTVLVVEDEPDVRSMVARVLTNAGHQVLLASNGLEGLRVASEATNPIDLVVSDVIMPEMGGPAMVTELRRRLPRLRSLFMSGYTAGQLELRGASMLRHNLIMKPFGIAELTARIEALVGEPVGRGTETTRPAVSPTDAGLSMALAG